MIMKFASDSNANFWKNNVCYSGCWSSNDNLIVSYKNGKPMAHLWGHLKLCITKEPYLVCSACWNKEI